jgi:hypothetical protein
LRADMLKILFSIALLTTALARSASADVGAYAEAVRQGTSDNYRAFSIAKLTTWKVGKKCWDKIVEPEGRIMSLTSFLTREIATYAKEVTTEKAANRDKVEQTVAAFKSRFSLSVAIDGDDCDGSHDPLWMQYVMRSIEALNATPTATGKAFLSITASSTAKKFSFTVGKDRSTFTLVGPKETAVGQWQYEVRRVFASVAKK